MSRRATSLFETITDRRAAGIHTEALNRILDHLDELLHLSNIDVDLIQAASEILDFTGITVRVGPTPSWDSVNKVLTVPAQKGDKGDRGDTGPQGPAGQSVSLTSVVDNNDGTFTWNFSDNSSFTTGDLTGKDGNSLRMNSVTSLGAGKYRWEFSDGTTYDTESLIGPRGAKGDKGEKGDSVRITRVLNMSNGVMRWGFSDGTFHTTPDLRGPTGATGATGPAGLSVKTIRATSTTDPEGKYRQAGEVDTYTMYSDVNGNDVIGTFDVRNGEKLDAYNLTYSNPNETPYPVGNVPAGTTFDKWTFTDLMDQLFYDSSDTPTKAYDFTITLQDTDPVYAVSDPNEGIIGKSTYPAGHNVIISEVNDMGAGPVNTYAGSNGGTFSINIDGTFSFDPGTDFETLPHATTQTSKIKYVITNTTAGISSEGMILAVVKGTNKAPIFLGPIADIEVESTDILGINTKQFFTKLNANTTNSLTYSLVGNSLPAGLNNSVSIDSSGYISGTLDRTDHTTSNIGVPGTWEVTVRAKDLYNEYVDGTFNLVISRPALVAQTLNLSVDADDDIIVAAVSPNNLLNTIAGKDTTNLTLVSIAGEDLLGAPTTVDNMLRGKITAYPSGAFEFYTNSEFDNLALGDNELVSIPYVVENDQGASVTGYLRITVQGNLTQPTVTEPTLSIVEFSIDDTVAVEGKSSTYTLAAVYNKGLIVHGDSSEEPRTGDVVNFEVVVGDNTYIVAPTTQNNTLATLLIDDKTLTYKGVSQVVSVRALVDAGNTPMDSNGNPVGTAFPQGYSNSETTSIPAATVFLWFASTQDNVDSEVPQTPMAFEPFGNTSNTSKGPAVGLGDPEEGLGDYKFIQIELGNTLAGHFRGIVVPKAWGKLKGYRLYVQAFNQWFWLEGGGSNDWSIEMPNSVAEFVETEVTRTALGVTADYYRYTFADTSNEYPRIISRFYFDK